MSYYESNVSGLLTTGEMNDCVRKAFMALDSEDQENIERLVEPLLAIHGMGRISALRLLFAIDRLADLNRLNMMLTEGG